MTARKRAKALEALKLLARRRGLEQTGDLLGVTGRTVQRWLGSETLIPARVAGLLAARASQEYSDDADDRAFAAEATAAVAKGEAMAGKVSPAAPPGDPKARAERTVEVLTGLLDRLHADKKSTPREIAQVSTSLTSATRLLARLSGSLEVSESQIARAPAFRRVLAVVLRVLEEDLADRPDVVRKIEEALRKLDETGS